MLTILRALFAVGFAACLYGADISGNWTIDVSVGGNSGSPGVTLKQDGEKLSGTYTGRFGKSELAGSVRGDKVEFRVDLDVQGEKLVVTYRGSIESDSKMKGTVSFGDYGEGTWSAGKK